MQHAQVRARHCQTQSSVGNTLAGTASLSVTARPVLTIAGTGAGYEHTDDGMQSGGAQNFSEGGGMKGAGMNSGMMPQGMKEGQGERHHGGQQGGGMQVCVYIHVKPLTELWSTYTSKNILQLLCHCIHATHLQWRHYLASNYLCLFLICACDIA